MNRQRDAVRDAVRDAEELDRQMADGDAVARADRDQPAVRVDAVLARASARPAPASAACRTPGRRGRRQHVRHGADVVLVAVRQHERGDAPPAAAGSVRSGMIRVDAEQLRVREHHAGVDHDRACRPRRAPSCSCRTRRVRRAARFRASVYGSPGERQRPQSSQDANTLCPLSGSLRQPSPGAHSCGGDPIDGAAAAARSGCGRAW